MHRYNNIISINNSKQSIYLPIALAVAIIFGFILGVKLAPISSTGDNVLFIRPDKENKVNDIIN